MPAAIALVGSLAVDEEAAFLAALAAAMPSEVILPLCDLTPIQRAAAEIAIVANPDPAQVRALPDLVWMHSLWAGVERLISELGPGAPPIVRLVDPEMARTMAEAVLAWTYYLQRDMPAYARQQRQRQWGPHRYRSPSSLTVGLLGLGALGAAAAVRLREAGFAVAGWSRSPKAMPGIETFADDDGLYAVLGRSDIVVCLIPLTAQTRGLLDARLLAAMKPGAAIVNFARGPIVVESDLLAALDAGHLSHAVLDVFEAEPLAPDSMLWSHPNITVLPHITGPTNHASAAVVVAANVRGYRESGKIPPCVDATRGY